MTQQLKEKLLKQLNELEITEQNAMERINALLNEKSKAIKYLQELDEHDPKNIFPTLDLCTKELNKRLAQYVQLVNRCNTHLARCEDVYKETYTEHIYDVRESLKTNDFIAGPKIDKMEKESIDIDKEILDVEIKLTPIKNQLINIYNEKEKLRTLEEIVLESSILNNQLKSKIIKQNKLLEEQEHISEELSEHIETLTNKCSSLSNEFSNY